MAVLIVLIILVVIAVIIYNAYTKKDKENKEDKEKETKLVYGKAFDAPRPEEDNAHLIVPIYSYSGGKTGWICRNCECENDSLTQRCCVCNTLR